MEDSRPKKPEEKKLPSINWSSAAQGMLVPVLAVFTAMIVGGMVIWLAGGNPFAAYAGSLSRRLWLTQGLE